MIIKCGDISNVCRPFDLAKKWAGILLSEYFRQGDIERERGLPTSPFMDRQHVVMAQMQLGFINSIAYPMFDLVATFAPDLRPNTADVLKANADQWSKLLVQVQEEQKQQQQQQQLQQQQQQQQQQAKPSSAATRDSEALHRLEHGKAK